MAFSLDDHSVGVLVPAGKPSFYSFDNSTAINASPSYGLQMTMRVSDLQDEDQIEAVTASYGATTWPLPDNLTGLAAFTASQLFDYRFRFWTIPTSLNLSNPTLGANIPFVIWNTFPEMGTVSSVTVTGSDVLSFDYDITDTINDNQYKTVNMVIAGGEPTIDASVVFVHDIGDAILGVSAIVATTFPILPEVPVEETWTFVTDILTNYKGVETRMSMMPEPRINLDFNVKVVDFAERQKLYDLTSGNIKSPATIPMFAYAAPLTATSALGDSRVYFDPALCNARVGRMLVLLNRQTQEVQLGEVTTLHADGATINGALGVELTPPLWFAVPGISCFIADDSGLDFGTQAGSFSLSADSVETWPLIRPASTQVVTTYDSLPVIEKDNLITSPERWAYRRELMDNSIGRQEMRSRDTNFVVKRGFKFAVDRQSDEMDYWRTFFSTIRGAQKPFLASTQLPDLTLRLPHADGGGSLDINETVYESKFFPLDTFKRLKVVYTDGSFSYHTVTNSATDASSNTQIALTPALTIGKTITRISFLQKLRSSDKVTLQHYNDYTYLKFGARTVN